MDTTYIRIVDGLMRRSYSPRAEFRIAPSEAFGEENRLDIAAYTWNTGDEMMTLSLTRETVVALHADLVAAGTGPAHFQGEGYYTSQIYDTRRQQWRKGASGVFDFQVIAVSEEAARATVTTPGRRTSRAWIEVLSGQDTIDGGCIGNAGLKHLILALESWLQENPAS